MGIHQSGRVYTAGPKLSEARGAVVLIHGRGASAADILTLVEPLKADDIAYLAPEAVGNTWYPYRFLEPVEKNEPHLSSALQRVGEVIAEIEAAGIPAERIVIAGFSQGACLAGEYAARNARRYAGVAMLSGGLIGDRLKAETYSGAFDGTPIFLGCSDVDFHIPVERVHESAAMLESLGGAVTEKIYPGMGHTISQDEIDHLRAILAQIPARES